MKKKISILGASGSIGLSTLNIVEQFPERFEVVGLAVQRNIERLESQIRQFHPKIVSVADESAGEQLRSRCSDLDIEILTGEAGSVQVATHPDVELVVASIVGYAGLAPTYKAVLADKQIALANKETLVVAGELIVPEVERRGLTLLPVDSEHNAIFQSLQGHRRSDLYKILLTCSGGPFRQHSLEELAHVSRGDALKHPNWEMGQKITIDSSTLMNKGLEVLEAHWLFGVDFSDIQVVVHPQSVIHSMVEYVDGSVIAQLGVPDMRIPIAYAMAYPERLDLDVERLNVSKIGNFSFEEPDFERFPCLRYAYDAGQIGGTMPAVLNAANEIVVEAFLQERISFLEIPRIIHTVMERHAVQKLVSLEVAIEADRWAREQTRDEIAQKS
ncbi:MAG: 1-deoxy-D-xylulose-5-phosphate reductoisomerase [bacterium]|nr:1-deoxy-D-xylulose-5-phosphate reductoisomerase [bacterium]